MVWKTGVAVILAGATMCAAAGEPEVSYRPLSVAGFAEAGMFNGARYGSNAPIETDWLDHFGVFITQTANVGDRMAFDIGLGGTFQFMKREIVQATWLGTQWKAFFIGPSVADIRYGSLKEGEGFGLQFGRFAYKYNQDATNLGEYLFRSGAYPTFLLGGGYSIIGSPRAYLQGLRLNYALGGLRFDVLAVTETTIPSLYDFSLATVAGWSIGDGFIDLAAGVNLKRVLPVRPSKTSPEVIQNSYFNRAGVDYTGNPTYYQEQAKFQAELATRALDTKGGTRVPTAADTAAAAAATARAAQLTQIQDEVGKWLGNPDSAGISPEYYTQQAIIGMFKASMDLKKVIDMPALGPEDLRLSVEANILGFKNYPVFYENIADRIPITASLNLPGFKILDQISVQAEYFKSPWMNSYANLLGSNGKNVPVPTMPSGSDPEWNRTEFNDVSKRDNLSWSLLLKKNMVGGAWAAAQFARDHSRMVSKDVWGGGGLEPTEVLGTEEDWYMMFQLGFGI